MVEFGWSVGCILAAIETGNKIRKALGDANGAKDHFRDTISFLEQSESVLKELERHIRDSPASRYQDAITQQLKLIEKPWTKLQTTLAKYENSLGERTSISKLKKISGTVRWVLKDLDEAVRQAKVEVLGPMKMIDCLLQVQSLQMLRDTSEKCQKMMDDLEIADLTIALQTGFDSLSHSATINRSEQTKMIEMIRQLQLLLSQQKNDMKKVLQKSDDVLCNIPEIDNVALHRQDEMIISFSQHLTAFTLQNTASHENIRMALKNQQESLDALLMALATLSADYKAALVPPKEADVTVEKSINIQEAISLLKFSATATSMFIFGYSMKSTALQPKPNTQPETSAEGQKHHTSQLDDSRFKTVNGQSMWVDEFNQRENPPNFEPELANMGSQFNSTVDDSKKILPTVEFDS